MRSLGALGEPSSVAASVNTQRRIVGSTTSASFSSLPFLWTPERGMQRLPMHGHEFGSATDLNEFGQILVFLDGRGALGTPTPGPLAAEPPDEGAVAEVAPSPEAVREARAAWCELAGKLGGRSRLGVIGRQVCRAE
jgi:hypothetical protein